MSEANLVYTECRSCKARIFWAKTTGGKQMPIDADSVQDGNLALVNGEVIVVKGDLFEEQLPEPRYKSHFATCPAAAKHRKEHK